MGLFLDPGTQDTPTVTTTDTRRNQFESGMESGQIVALHSPWLHLAVFTPPCVTNLLVVGVTDNLCKISGNILR